MQKSSVALKVVIATITISAIIFGAYYFVSGRIFRLYKIQVSFDQKVTQQYLFSDLQESTSLRLAKLKGQPIWSLDLEKILENVTSDLRVKSAKISRLFPDRIQVTVTPHLPVASVIGVDSTKIFPVSVDGELLPNIQLADIPDGPILRGEEFIKDKMKRSTAVEIIRLLPESGVLSQKNVSEIYFDKKNGYQLLLTPSGIEVYLGFDDFARRLSQSSRVAQYLNQENLSGRIIDARFHKKVVVKLRNEP